MGQSSNPDMPAIIFQSSGLSSVFPKKNPTGQGQDLDAPAADTHAFKVPYPGMFPWWGCFAPEKLGPGKVRGQFVDI